MSQYDMRLANDYATLHDSTLADRYSDEVLTEANVGKWIDSVLSSGAFAPITGQPQEFGVLSDADALREWLGEWFVLLNDEPQGRLLHQAGIALDFERWAEAQTDPDDPRDEPDRDEPRRYGE